MRTYKSESDNIPIEWDTTSSKRVVYHNYNVKQIERRDDIAGEAEPRIAYVYDVDEYSKDEYKDYLIENLAKDITETGLEMANYCVDLDYRLLLMKWGV